MADAYQKVKDWLMARGALDKAAGTTKPAPPPAQAGAQDYLKKQIAMNPNNKPADDEDEDEKKVSPVSNKLKAGKK